MEVGGTYHDWIWSSFLISKLLIPKVKENVSENGLSQITRSSFYMRKHRSDLGIAIDNVKFRIAFLEVEWGHSGHVQVLIAQYNHMFKVRVVANDSELACVFAAKKLRQTFEPRYTCKRGKKGRSEKGHVVIRHSRNAFLSD